MVHSYLGPAFKKCGQVPRDGFGLQLLKLRSGARNTALLLSLLLPTKTEGVLLLSSWLLGPFFWSWAISWGFVGWEFGKWLQVVPGGVKAGYEEQFLLQRVVRH